jgi:hypothetical protein
MSAFHPSAVRRNCRRCAPCLRPTRLRVVTAAEILLVEAARVVSLAF